MIKLIVSDFDGVLLDLKEIHFNALNMALNTIDEKYVISSDDHIKIFDGLSTKKKLEILSKTKNLPIEQFATINNLKQKFTVDLLNKFDNINYDIASTINSLKNKGYLFYVASNAIKHTIELGLKKLKIDHLVDKIYSNQDVKNSKPHSEIYLKCMVDAGVNPSETIIIEDSKHGREAAVKSGANVCVVDNSFDFSLSRIENVISSNLPKRIRWAGKDTTILIPMSGAGSRFQKEGYKLPKPLIDINGKPMIQHVVENINIDGNYVFVVQKEHYDNYNLGTILSLIAPGCKIVQTQGLTEGAACSTLLAKEFINNNDHLVIANSDQFVEWDSCDFMYSMLSNELDGGILSFIDTNPKWSFAKLDEFGFVTEVAEKNPISNIATVGIYYYKYGKEYVQFAEQMIDKNIRFKNEFYVCPVFNEFIKGGKKIKTKECHKMWGLGTPEDLTYFLANYK